MADPQFPVPPRQPQPGSNIPTQTPSSGYGHPTPPPQTTPPTPTKRGNVLTSKPVIGIAALVVGIALGAGTAGGGKQAPVTAAAAPTVTVTATATVDADDQPTDEPTTEPSEEPTDTQTSASAPEKKSYVTLSSRKFKLLVKDPDAYTGKTYVIYGEITQFDSATGTDTFRADTGPKKLRISYGYVDYEQNSMLNGDETKLKKLVEGDCFKAKVTVLGSYSYDTQAGGNTTVPLFQVDSISVYDSTD